MSIPGNSLSPVNLLNPINSDHPLNRGRVGWWLTIPELAGGSTFHDLIGGMPGTLTNMGSGSGWASTTRKGGAGKLIFDGTNDHVIATPSPAMGFGASTPFTIAAWVAFNSASACVMFCKRNSANNYPFVMFRTATATLRLYTNNGADHFIDSGVVTITNGLWCRIVMWNDGTNGRIYINGVPTIAATAQASGSSTAGSVYIGAQNTGAGISSPFTGSMDDVSAWNRVLTESEIQDDFIETSLGYPNALNRRVIRKRTSVSTPTGTGAASLPHITASGTGIASHPGTGSATLPHITASGASVAARTGSGAVTLPAVIASGSGIASHRGTAAISLPSLTASGIGASSGTTVTPGSGRRAWSHITGRSYSHIVGRTASHIAGRTIRRIEL